MSQISFGAGIQSVFIHFFFQSWFSVGSMSRSSSSHCGTWTWLWRGRGCCPWGVVEPVTTAVLFWLQLAVLFIYLFILNVGCLNLKQLFGQYFFSLNGMAFRKSMLLCACAPLCTCACCLSLQPCMWLPRLMSNKLGIFDIRCSWPLASACVLMKATLMFEIRSDRKM